MLLKATADPGVSAPKYPYARAKAVREPQPVIVLIGNWLMAGPFAVIGAAIFIHLCITFLLHPGELFRGGAFAVIVMLAFVPVCGVVTWLLWRHLYRTTKVHFDPPWAIEDLEEGEP